jgi:hypothetical protein
MPGSSAPRMTALVVETDDPLDNRMGRGDHSLGLVRILTDGPSPLLAAGRFKLDRDHWVVRGMRLPVAIDPAAPDGFEIAWEEVPSIEARVAANDPTLADPTATRDAVMQALGAAGVMADAANKAPQDPRVVALAAQVAAGAWDDPDGSRANFQSSLDDAAAAAAPAGSERAVALVATSLATLKQEGGGEQDIHRFYRDRHGKHDVVLAITQRGRPPYAVFVPGFKHERGKSAAVGAGLPAAVSTSNPNDVRVLWDEMLSIKKQNQQTKAAALEQRDARMDQYTQAASQPPITPAATAPGSPQPTMPVMPTVPAGMPGVPAEMQGMLKQNAMGALAATADPAARQMIITQYRAMGIELEDEATPPPPS